MENQPPETPESPTTPVENSQAPKEEAQVSEEPQVKERHPRMLAVGHLKHRLPNMGIYSVKTDRTKRAELLAVKPTTPVHKIG